MKFKNPDIISDCLGGREPTPKSLYPPCYFNSGPWTCSVASTGSLLATQNLRSQVPASWIRLCLSANPQVIHTHLLKCHFSPFTWHLNTRGLLSTKLRLTQSYYKTWLCFPHLKNKKKKPHRMSQRIQIPNFFEESETPAASGVCIPYGTSGREVSSDCPHLRQVSSCLPSPTAHAQPAAIISNTCLDTTGVPVSTPSSHSTVLFYRKGEQAQKG